MNLTHRKGGDTVNQDKWREARQARTLMQAHDALSALRPSEDAAPAVWRDYYLRSARVYAEIAEVDRGHHHEALYWADRERQKAMKPPSQH
ncbi:hypothetical protein SAMN05216266_107291 [Amycolatopsis marina]|uniref:Uncharacterized protein n=1 Tax=Amycolatopsis marina TaxID=490629 RepID=A0A1I0ZUC4_9PSEU|nr:hypothetical protein SAMN05216266_107291 [Amycolatopsis marina]